MIEREITPNLRRWFKKYPVLTITGPRQSGKTTLARQAFPHLRYVDLEAPVVQEAATIDPRGFLARFPDGVILDEIQHVPDLASYIKVAVDADRRNGRFVLTGSEQFGLTRTISQSLVGRSALFRLWPFSLAERRLAGGPGGIDEILHSGFLPRLHSEGLHPPRRLRGVLPGIRRTGRFEARPDIQRSGLPQLREVARWPGRPARQPVEPES